MQRTFFVSLHYKLRNNKYDVWKYDLLAHTICNRFMRKKAIKILWSTYAALLLLGAIVVLCVEQGWIGYMPPIDELQNPISKQPIPEPASCRGKEGDHPDCDLWLETRCDAPCFRDQRG